MENKVCEGKGIITEKSEAVKSDGAKYWKFKILLTGDTKPKTFSLWEYEAGADVSIKDTVKLYWSEKPGTSQTGAPITYRNINSIVKGESIPSEDIESTPGFSFDFEDVRFKSMIFKKAVDVCLGKFTDIKSFKEHFEEVYNSLIRLAKKVL